MYEGVDGGAGPYLRGQAGPWRVAIRVSSVVEVVPRVTVRPLPGAPPGVTGVITYRGEVAVVVDLRERFGAPAPARSWDPFVVVAGSPLWALVLDAADRVGDAPTDVSVARDLPSAQIAGVAVWPDGSVLLVDRDRLLDPSEVEALRAALAELARGAA